MSIRKLFSLTLLLTLMLCSSAFANSFESRGSIIVSGIVAKRPTPGVQVFSIIRLTNISGSDVDCRVKVYDQEGTVVTNYCKILKALTTTNQNIAVASGADSFSIPAGGVRTVSISVPDATRVIMAHAVIEWSSDNEHVKKALIASGNVGYRDLTGYSASNLVIIGDQPF